MIPFNKPHLTGKEVDYLYEAVASGKLSGNGSFTARVHEEVKRRYDYKKTLLTSSCTDALEMCALLARIEPGDEVIMPSFTFVSTANAFLLRGSQIRFVDSMSTHPNMDHELVEELITNRTKAIVAMHYAGVACEMDALSTLARKYDILLIEDAAQAIDSTYRDSPLGGIGQLGAFSFHETKNIISGEGGMLVVNDDRFIERSEIIWEKGTNRTAFYRGEVDKYGWVDIGSSFLPSEIIASFLYAQLEEIDSIQKRRIYLWERYYDGLKDLENEGKLGLPFIPDYATNNGHLFYILCANDIERTSLIEYVRQAGAQTVFHYVPLHLSQFYRERHDGRELPMVDRYSETLLRLPLFVDLTEEEQDVVISAVREYYE